jgi:hypothetical protein
MEQQPMMILLEPILQDAPSMPFPVESIRMELVGMLLSQEEFRYFLERAHVNLTNTYGRIVASVFIEVVKQRTLFQEENIYEVNYIEYTDRIESMIELLEQIRITTISRESPDYEIIRELAKK